MNKGSSILFFPCPPEASDPLLPGSPLIIVILGVEERHAWQGAVLWKSLSVVPMATLPSRALPWSRDFPLLCHAGNFCGHDFKSRSVN